MSRVFNKNQLTGWVDGNRFIKILKRLNYPCREFYKE